MLKKKKYGLLSFKDSALNTVLLDGDHLSSNKLTNSNILLFNQHDSNSVEEETMMYSSTSNLKIGLYKLTTCVRIPLDVEFFLSYKVYHSRQLFIISLPTAHYGTSLVDRNTIIEFCDAHSS